jgi:hypothetical protein
MNRHAREIAGALQAELARYKSSPSIGTPFRYAGGTPRLDVGWGVLRPVPYTKSKAGYIYIEEKYAVELLLKMADDGLLWCLRQCGCSCKEWFVASRPNHEYLPGHREKMYRKAKGKRFNAYNRAFYWKERIADLRSELDALDKRKHGYKEQQARLEAKIKAAQVKRRSALEEIEVLKESEGQRITPGIGPNVDMTLTQKGRDKIRLS